MCGRAVDVPLYSHVNNFTLDTSVFVFPVIYYHPVIGHLVMEITSILLRQRQKRLWGYVNGCANTICQLEKKAKTCLCWTMFYFRKTKMKMRMHQTILLHLLYQSRYRRQAQAMLLHATNVLKWISIDID